MRKLASVQKIVDISPIENADSIERVGILGWNVVTKKGEFNIGDKVIYCEIDSIFPEKPEFEFLRNKNFRIRTIKLRGQVSQGICFPLSLLKNKLNDEVIESIEEDTDLTEILEIRKYEPVIPAVLNGIAKGNFPNFVPKTDETRIQSIPHILEKYRNSSFFITEKLDGSSMTVFLKDGEFGVCSRNLEISRDETIAFWKAVIQDNIEEKLRAFTEKSDIKNISIQGELIGSSIQDNKYALSGFHFRAFNIFNINKYNYLSFNDFINTAKEIGIETVPILDSRFILNHTVEELVELSKGNSKLNEKTKREGIIFRPLEEIRDFKIGRLSFKVINPDFLLKYNE